MAEELIIGNHKYFTNQPTIGQFFEGKKIWYMARQAKKIGLYRRKEFLEIMQIHSKGHTYHYLYAFLNKQKDFLYIGQTKDFDQRMRQHKGKHWWDLVSEIKLELVQSKEIAVRKEECLIRELKPKHNKTYHVQKLKQQDVPNILYGKIREAT